MTEPNYLIDRAVLYDEAGNPIDTVNPLPVEVTNVQQTDGLTDVELRAAPVPVVLSSNGGQDVFIKTTPAEDTDPGLVVRTAGITNVQQMVNGQSVSPTNKLPVEAHLTDSDGIEFSDTNRLPVELGTTTIQASFESIVSTGNTRTTPLAANEVFVGVWEEVIDYASISLAITTDAGTPMDGARAQFSIDGVNVVAEQVTTFGPMGGQAFFTLAPEASFFRIHYTNGAVAQTVLLAEITYHFNAVGTSQAPLGGPSDDRSVVGANKAFLHGRHPSGFWAAIKSTIDGILSVAVENIVSVKKVNGRTTGVLSAGATNLAAQTVFPATPATAIVLEVPDGHSSSAVELSAFEPGTRVIFEQSDTGLDGTWAATNMRRNTTPDVNDAFSQIENDPVGTNNVQLWKGTVGGIKYFRVRCASITATDVTRGVSVVMETSEGVGGTYLLGNPPSVSDYFTEGTITTAGQTLQVRTNGMGTVAAAFIGQFSGRLHFEISVDGVTWRAASAVVARGENAQSVLGTGIPNQILGARAPVGGTKLWRIRAGDDFAGSMLGELRAGAGSSAIFVAAPIQIGGLYTGAQTNRAAVGTAAVRLDPIGLVERKSVEILYQANGAANNGVVYVGFTGAVTAGNGRALQPGEAWTLDVTERTQLWAIASAASQQVQVTELA